MIAINQVILTGYFPEGLKLLIIWTCSSLFIVQMKLVPQGGSLFYRGLFRWLTQEGSIVGLDLGSSGEIWRSSKELVGLFLFYCRKVSCSFGGMHTEDGCAPR